MKEKGYFNMILTKLCAYLHSEKCTWSQGNSAPLSTSTLYLKEYGDANAKNRPYCNPFSLWATGEAVRWSKKSWLKILFVDLLWEKKYC